MVHNGNSRPSVPRQILRQIILTHSANMKGTSDSKRQGLLRIPPGGIDGIPENTPVDIETGEEVWKAPRPAGGQATPMTYEIAGKQYIVIAAGGHGSLGTTLGDYVVAFALP